MPSQIFLAATPSQLKEILCQRCHLLKEFNLAIDVTAETVQFQAIADEIKKKSPALLLIMVDLTDLPHSFYSGFAGLYISRVLLLIHKYIGSVIWYGLVLVTPLFRALASFP